MTKKEFSILTGMSFVKIDEVTYSVQLDGNEFAKLYNDKVAGTRGLTQAYVDWTFETVTGKKIYTFDKKQAVCLQKAFEIFNRNKIIAQEVS